MAHARRRIGLLGGSFNPAHAGHLHLSEEALKSLDLDEIWWLVAPANPLKSPKDLAAYETRVESAQRIVKGHRDIHVSSVEARHGWRYTIATVRGLKRLHPGIQFVWVMGADNLEHFHKWKRWGALASSIPIAVFDRAPFTFNAIHSRFALRYRRHRVRERDAAQLVHMHPPAWVYVHMRRHALSATLIRNLLGARAFLAHNEEIQTS